MARDNQPMQTSDRESPRACQHTRDALATHTEIGCPVTAPPASRPSLWKSKSFQLTLGVCISLACLWFAAGDVIRDEKQRKEFVDAFKSANYRLLPLLLLMLAAFYTLKAYRWKLLLSPLGEYRTWSDCFGPMLSGFAINNVLPARLGEFVRVLVFARQASLPIASVFTTVALERILDTLSILLLLGVGLVSLPNMSGDLQKPVLIAGAFVLTGVMGAVSFLIWTSVFVRIINGMLSLLRIPEQLREKIGRILVTAANGLSSLKSPRMLAVIVGVSLLQWILNGTMMYISLRSFGVEVPYMACWVLLGVVAIGVAVPAAPGFFGVLQVGFTQTLQIFKVAQPAVLAASIYYHMMQYIPVTVIGLIWLSRSGFRMQEAENSLPAESPAP